MIVQFIVSLMLFIAILFAMLFIVVRTVSRKLLGQPVSIQSLGLSMLGSFVALAVVTYFLVTGVLDLAQKGVQKLADTGREAVTQIVSFGSVAVLEGFGRTSDYFEQKWDAQLIEHSRALRVSVVSATLEPQGDGIVLKLTLELDNTGAQEIDVNELIRYQCILLKNDQGLCFPLEEIGDRIASRLPPETASVRVVEVPVPAAMNFTHLRTPNGEVALFPVRTDDGISVEQTP